MTEETNKPLDPRLRPLLELLARRAYEDIKAGKFEKPRNVPDQSDGSIYETTETALIDQKS